VGATAFQHKAHLCFDLFESLKVQQCNLLLEDRMVEATPLLLSTAYMCRGIATARDKARSRRRATGGTRSDTRTQTNRCTQLQWAGCEH
jgi:hypothetical protein